MGEYERQSTEEPHAHVDRRIQRIVMHPEWNYEKSDVPFIKFKYDLALLKLEEPVEYDLHVIPICLPEDDDKLVGRLAWVKGYGYLDYDIEDLQQGVKIIIFQKIGFFAHNLESERLLPMM